MSNSRVRQNQYNHIKIDEIQCKSKKCPTPELDKTNKKTINIDQKPCKSMNCPTFDENYCKTGKCQTPQLDKTNKKQNKSMEIDLNIGNVQLQSQTKPRE